MNDSAVRPLGWPQGPEFEAETARFWMMIPPAERAIVLAAVRALTSSGTGIEVAVGNLKGGVGKTTTAVYLALLLALTGDPVAVIDADPQNHSILRWKEAAGDNWPTNINVLPWATTDLPRMVRAMRGQYKHLIIDTSPSYADILRAALNCVSTFLITTQPNPMDVVQLSASVNEAVAIDAVRENGLASLILICRAKRNTNLLTGAFAHFDQPDPGDPGVSWPYLDTYIADRVGYAECFGTFPWEWADYARMFAEYVAYEAGLEAVPGLQLAGGQDQGGE